MTPEQDRDEERAAIVAWLRKRAKPHSCKADNDIADAIEAGKHHEG